MVTGFIIWLGRAYYAAWLLKEKKNIINRSTTEKEGLVPLLNTKYYLN